MAQKIQLRRDTAANWTTANPILAQGELGFEIDTSKSKVGDGLTAWNSRPYTGVATAGWTQDGAGAVSRTVDSKLKDVVSVKDFGAVGDGVADDTAAVQAMIASIGYVFFTPGDYKILTITIDAPIYFGEGAAVTVPVGNTLSITNRIESPRQWIFKGDGSYSLDHDLNSGEDSRQIHASWFGAFPSLDQTVDMAPRIQKAVNSFGNLRESIIDFDIGNYRVGQQITLTRACWIRGSGSRRTVFSQLTDGFTTFVTGEVACRISGCNFENVGMGGSVRASHYIEIAHDDCDLYDIKCGRAFRSIVVRANACRIDNIIYVFDASAGAPAVGSSVIAVRGNDNRITNILGYTSADQAPSYIVHLGANVGSLGCGNNLITNVTGITPAICVYLDATNVTLNRVQVKNVTQNAFTGPVPEAVIKLETAGSSSINGVIVDGVLSTSHPSNGIILKQSSSGTTQDVLLDGISFDAMSGAGIKFEQTSGTLREVIVGSTVDMSEVSTPYSYSGTYSNIRISPTAVPGVNAAFCYDFSIGDDSVAIINLDRSIFTAFGILTVGTSNYWTGTLRAASSPTSVTINVSANVNTSASVLSGTTGVDGKFTIGLQDKTIYLENRLGSTQRVSFSLLTGVT
jgi:hypothetical protein